MRSSSFDASGARKWGCVRGGLKLLLRGLIICYIRLEMSSRAAIVTRSVATLMEPSLNGYEKQRLVSGYELHERSPRPPLGASAHDGRNIGAPELEPAFGLERPVPPPGLRRRLGHAAAPGARGISETTGRIGHAGAINDSRHASTPSL